MPRHTTKSPLKGGPGKIRVSRGSLKGRNLRFHDAPDLRPTLNRIRESVFDLLAPLSQTHGFIDLFAGTGVMGISAYSNGFSPVHLVERNTEVLADLAKNLNALGISEWVSVHQSDSMRWLKTSSLPDKVVVYADPPFSRPDLHRKILDILKDRHRNGSHLRYVAEFEGRPPVDFHEYGETTLKKYGRTQLALVDLFLN